jgi:hypothetical protein
MLMLPKELVGLQPDAIFASVVLSPSNHEEEEKHAQAAGFPFRRDVGGCGYDTRRGARRDARNEVGQWHTIDRIRPGFFRRMVPSIPERPGAAPIGSRSGEEQVARAHRTASRGG